MPIEAQEELIQGIAASKEEEEEEIVDPALTFMEKMENMGISVKKPNPYSYSYYSKQPPPGSFG